MRSILLHVAEDEALDARTQVALDLARAFDGHLSCLQAVSYDYGVPGEFYGGMLADMVPALREAAENLRAQCERRLAPEDVRWSWELEDGRAHEHLLRRSSLNDVVVLGSREPLSRDPSLLARYLITRLHTPMLLVPEHVKGLDCAGTAVVAWDGSAEASRALKAARPLLARARSVVLASVVDAQEKVFDLPAVEGAEYLSRHGIACEMVEFPLRHGSVAKTLAAGAAQGDAAYLVMGAYGHSRLVETILGGVTREILDDPPLTVFTVH